MKYSILLQARSFYLTLFILVMGSPCLFAQTSVTFTVDMTGQSVSPNGVFLVGNFNDPDYFESVYPVDYNSAYSNWTPGEIQMSNQSAGSSIYSVTLSLNPAKYEFFFLNGPDWMGSESVNETCQVGEGNTNRFIHVSTSPTAYNVCWGSCAPCGQRAVRFRFNPSGLSSVSPNGIHVVGAFNSWNAAATPLYQNSAGIYEAVVNTGTSSVLAYKFVNGSDFSGSENLPVGSVCTSGSSGGNRNVVLTSDNTILPIVCWNSCETCNAVVLANVPNYVPTPGLVAYWPFEGDINDASGHGYDGVANEVAFVSDRFGVANSAGFFNDVALGQFNSQAVISEVNAFNLTQFSIVGWMKSDQSSHMGYQTLFNYGSNDLQGYWFGILNGNPTLYMNSTDISSSEFILDATWHMVAATYDGATAKIYVDGQLNLTQNSMLNITQTMNPTIGNDAFNDRFQGKIDDLGVWNRALTSAEISQLFVEGIPLLPIEAAINQPDSITLCNGESVTLEVFSSNDVQFQWYLNSTALDGANSSTLTVSEPGWYNVKVSRGSDCWIWSKVVQIFVPAAIPAFSVQSATSEPVCEGNTIWHQVQMPGAQLSNYSIQWNLNGQPIAGATGSTYYSTVSGVYSVDVSNSSGCTRRSSEWTVTVVPLPNVQVVNYGLAPWCDGNANTIAVENNPSWEYQWYTYPEMQIIDGATTAELVLYNSGNYIVSVVEPNGCSAYSEVISVVSSGLSGCTDPLACNYNPMATCDNGLCLQIDACGECGGIGTSGCTDATACNYNALATCDDQSCSYVQLYSIEGALTPQGFDEIFYSYQNTPGSTYTWSFGLGVIVTGQGTNQISVICGPPGLATICVQETTAEGCIGEEVCMNIMVLPVSVEENNIEAIRIYPNPASDYINIQCDPSLIGEEYAVYDVVGKVVMKGKVSSSKSNIPVTDLALGSYLVKCGVHCTQLIKK
ncbi:MAG: hypothetical protein RL092_610 [Bacteroidota bacterium]|jgi:hypothetical protein